ncbi:MAG: glycosyl hydrolase [Chitinophagaceae bacterium]|nr:glycosyl hydrolase [Chitinophagaceae bacterium]
MNKKLRFLALYLPQYHPIEENNKWWGNGFTEWSNVVKGKQLHKDQYQPHIPKDLGFYDLRLPEVREQQAELARQYGIYGFIYYHYWFNSKLMLEKPLQEVIKLQKPDFPFCICWANENWSRRWDGQDKEMLLEQKYSIEDNKAHLQYLCENIFNDKRYITIDGKPVFMVYKADLVPSLDATIDVWNEVAQLYGFKGVYVMGFERAHAPTEYNGVNKLNAFAEFSPFLGKLKLNRNVIDKALVKLNIPLSLKQKNKFFSYKDLLNHTRNKNYHTDKKTLYPCVTPMWDNYVRRRNGNAEVFLGSTPELYQEWLQIACDKFTPQNDTENFVLINAWNEWAEGNHLEPCEKWGHKYLEATKKVADQFK